MTASQTTGKYNSIAALLWAVENVGVDLSHTEQLVLFVIAHKVDYETGGRKVPAHPGNWHFKKITGVKTDQGVQAILNKLIAKGLIERVGKGAGGRKIASSFRLCIESSLYPAPQKPPTDDLGVSSSQQPPTGELGVSTKPPTGAPETPNCGTGNPQLADPKPPTGDIETPNQSSWGRPVVPTTNPTPNPTLSAGGVVVRPNPHDYRNKPKDWEASTWLEGMGSPESYMTQLKKLAADSGDFGWQKIWAGVIEFKTRPKGLFGANNPWALFLKEKNTYMPNVKVNEDFLRKFFPEYGAAISARDIEATEARLRTENLTKFTNYIRAGLKSSYFWLTQAEKAAIKKFESVGQAAVSAEEYKLIYDAEWRYLAMREDIKTVQSAEELESLGVVQEKQERLETMDALLRLHVGSPAWQARLAAIADVTDKDFQEFARVPRTESE